MGEWANNVEEGFGTKTWVKGHKYEGEWMSGMRHGKGTFWVKEGGRLRKQYAGDWQNDQRHGKGIFMMVRGQVVPQATQGTPLNHNPTLDADANSHDFDFANDAGERRQVRGGMDGQ